MFQLIGSIVDEIKIQRRRPLLAGPIKGETIDLLVIALTAVQLAKTVSTSDEDNKEMARQDFEKALRQYDWGIK
jgi:hypothetical protein